MRKKIHANCDFTIEEIEKYLHSRRIPFEVTLVQVLEYWKIKDWLTLKGEKVRTVSSAVNVANSYVIQQRRKNGVVDFGKILEQKEKSGEWINKKSPYNEQLNDERWKAFRDFIFAVRGRRCEACGRLTKLQIHHREYIQNRFAWEYLPNDVMVVCGDCHRYIHKIKV